MRVIRATRRLARSNPARHDVNHLLREARSTLLAALYVDELEIRVFIDQDAGTPDSLGLKMAPEVRRALDEAAARAWTHQRVLIIEPGHVWGDPELAAYADWFTTALDKAGFEAVVVAPVGVDDKVLGMLMCARRTGSRRWTDGEGVAALELGHDLGRAIANAQATQRERRLLEELRELEVARHWFLRELTHEINNPMTVIAANAEFLASSETIDERDQRRAQAILRASERLGDLLQGLAMLSQVSDPQHPPAMQQVDLVPVVEETLAAMTAVAERSGITLHLVGDLDEAVVLGDPREIASAVSNLVDNAVKYSDAGHEVWIGVERRPDGGLSFVCKRRGARHLRGRPGQPLRAAVPLDQRGGADAARHGPRPRHRAGDHAAPRRQHRGRVDARSRHPRPAELPAARASGRLRVLTASGAQDVLRGGRLHLDVLVELGEGDGAAVLGGRGLDLHDVVGRLAAHPDHLVVRTAG